MTEDKRKTEFFKAIRNNDLYGVERLLREGQQANVYNSEGESAVYCALRTSNPVLVTPLLNAGARPSQPNTDYRKESPIHLCVYQPLHVAELLLDHGAYIDAQDDKGETTIEKAVFSTKPELVKLLIARGADINKPERDGRVPLNTAIRLRRTEILEILLDAGASLNTSHPPLIDAIGSKDINLIKRLIKSGANVDQYQEGRGTPVSIAAASGSMEIINAVAAGSRDFNKPLELSYSNYQNEEPWRTTVLSQACATSREAALYFLKKGASVHGTRSPNDFSPLAAAIQLNDAELVRTLLEKGADANAPFRYRRKENSGDLDRATPMELAIRKKSVEIITLLLKSGADVNRSFNNHPRYSSEGHKPIFYAVHGKDKKIIKMLIDAGANPNDGIAATADPDILKFLVENGLDLTSKDGFLTPAFYSAYGKIESLRMIKNSGARLELLTHEGYSSIMHLVRWEYNIERDAPEIMQKVKFLMDCGADIHATGNDGETALTLARKAWKKNQKDKPLLQKLFGGNKEGPIVPYLRSLGATR